MKEAKTKLNLKLRALDLFFLIRPPMLIPVWTFFLAGYWRAMGVSVREIPGFIKGSIFLEGNFWISFVAYSLLLGSIYIVNQIVDRESDKKNKKLFLIPFEIISVKLAVFISIILVIISFGMTYRFGILYVVFLLISFVIGLFYSLPPFRVKGRPVLDILSNAAGYGILAFGIGWLTAVSFNWKIFILCIPYFFATASVFVVSTILDMEGDRNDGASTTAVKFGDSTSLFIGVVMLLFALISAILLSDLLIIVTSVISLPLLIKALVSKQRKFITLYMRGGSYVLIFLVGILFPWYFLILLFIFFISKYYYKYRFDINYPELLEKEN